MVLDRHLDPFGQASERPLALAYVNSAYETGIKSPLDAAILKRGGAAINGLPEDRRDPVRLRAPAALGRRREQRRAPADHQGGPGGRPRLLHGLRDRRSPGPARRGDAGALRSDLPRAERSRISRPGRRLRGGAAPGRVLGPRRARARARRLRDLLRSAAGRRRRGAPRAPPRRRRGEDPHRRQRAGRPARLRSGRPRQCPHRRSATRSSA